MNNLRLASSKSVSPQLAGRYPKEFQIQTILAHFESLHTEYYCFTDDRKSFWGAPEVSTFNFFSNSLTETVTWHLMVPPCLFVEVANALEGDLFVPRGASQYYSKSILKTVAKTLHPLCQPPTTLCSFQDFSNFVIQSICKRIRHLAQSGSDVRSYIQCFDPSCKPIAHHTGRDLIISCLQCKYSSELVTYWFTGPNQQYQKHQNQQLKMHVDDLFQASQEFWSDVENYWPTVPTLQTNLKCMQNYFNGSQWFYSSVCSLCSHKRNCSDFLTKTFSPSQKDSKITMEHLEILRCQDRQQTTPIQLQIVWEWRTQWADAHPWRNQSWWIY